MLLQSAAFATEVHKFWVHDILNVTLYFKLKTVTYLIHQIWPITYKILLFCSEFDHKFGNTEQILHIRVVGIKLTEVSEIPTTRMNQCVTHYNREHCFIWHCISSQQVYLLSNRGVAVLLPGFAINWYQNQVTRQPHLCDPTHFHLCLIKKVKFCNFPICSAKLD